MAKTAEEIISLVNEIQKTEKELEQATISVERAKRHLDEFKDTGNKYLAVSFNHGSGWENLYSEFEFPGIYPSEKVRNAVIADLELAIRELEVARDDLAIKLENMKKSLVE